MKDPITGQLYLTRDLMLEVLRHCGEGFEKLATQVSKRQAEAKKIAGRIHKLTGSTLDQNHSIPDISEDAVDQLKMAQRRAQHQRWARMSPEERDNLIKSQLPATTSEPEEPFVGMEM